MPFDYRKQYQLYKQRYLKNFQFTATSNSTKITLNLTLFLLLLSFLILFVLKPTIITIANLWQEIKLKREYENKLAAKIQSLKTAQTNLEKASPLLPLFEKSLPSESQFLYFERELQFLAFKNNLLYTNPRWGKFDLIKKTVTAKNPSLVEVDLQFTLSGGYQNLLNYLQDLNNLDRIVVVEALNWETKDNQLLNLSVKGKFYYLF